LFCWRRGKSPHRWKSRRAGPRALRYKRAAESGWGWRRPRARAIGDSPALRDENASDDAEAQLAAQAGERGDEFALKPLRVEEAGAMPPAGCWWSGNEDD